MVNCLKYKTIPHWIIKIFGSLSLPYEKKSHWVNNCVPKLYLGKASSDWYLDLASQANGTGAGKKDITDQIFVCVYLPTRKKMCLLSKDSRFLAR